MTESEWTSPPLVIVVLGAEEAWKLGGIFWEKRRLNRNSLLSGHCGVRVS
jgi:hypothetical protein